MMRAEFPFWLVVSSALCLPGTGGCADDGDGVDPAVDAGAQLDAAGPPSPMVPELYPDDRTLSPITPYVAANLRDIAALGPALRDDVFAKVGTGSSVSSNFLHCLDDGHVDPAPGAEPGAIDLDGRDHLRTVIDFFRDGDAAGSNPYRRASEAAGVGFLLADIVTTTGDPGTDPSAFAREVAAIAPRFALIAVGEHDIPDDDLDSFGSQLLELAEQAVEAGVVPVFTAIPPRADDPALAAEVAHYNAVVRGVAQAHQVPFIDIYRELVQQPGLGLGEGGVLPSVYRPAGLPGGPARACVFTDESLAHGYNVRNLRALETLDRLIRTAIDGEPAPDAHSRTLSGAGTAADPYIIDQLPFTHVADTAIDGAYGVDSYPGCQAPQDESGPELVYRLQIATATRVRAVVVDRADADIDVHILADSPDGDACIERAHRIISAELAPGTYYFNLDTYVSSIAELSGEYLFALTEEPL